MHLFFNAALALQQVKLNLEHYFSIFPHTNSRNSKASSLELLGSLITKGPNCISDIQQSAYNKDTQINSDFQKLIPFQHIKKHKKLKPRKQTQE